MKCLKCQWLIAMDKVMVLCEPQKNGDIYGPYRNYPCGDNSPCFFFEEKQKTS